MSTNFRPTDGRILARRIESSTTKGGIVLADGAGREPLCRATVLEVGPGKRDQNGVRHPLPFSVGATVLCGRYAGAEHDLGDYGKVIVIDEADVLGVIES